MNFKQALIHILMVCSFFAAEYSFAIATDERGLLPEVKTNSKDESANEKKSITSELLITKTETKAIDALQNLIKRKKGLPEEADLQYRLAELYMRRSKSGRFFEVFMNEKTKQLSSIPKTEKSGHDWVRKAIAIYFKIENEFPKYSEMDSVLFNNAFANQQLALNRVAETLYEKLIKSYPNSPLRSDALLASAELLYDQARFADAMDKFKMLEKYPEARVYSYAMYKMAWAYYNMKKSEEGIKKLSEVVKLNPLETETQGRGYYLRKEALRDLALFVGDTYKASELYPFFNSFIKDEELGNTILLLTQLYESHSREKEMNIFLDEFISKNPKNAYLVKTHLALVNANETLKLRDKVIEHLNFVQDLCKPGSSWRLTQVQSAVEESCGQEFHHASLDIAKKWWEIWLKNKQNTTFSALTEKALRLVLDNDNLEKPDVKTRYALAELLVQQNKFASASDEYKTVSEKATDPQLAHDALYGALYSKEKSMEGKKDAIQQAQRKDLALTYLKKYPQGAHFQEVQFQVALTEYEEKNYDESLKLLKVLSENKSKSPLKVKAEDLILDIYNLKKDYTELKKRSEDYLKTETADTRKAQLKKINEEAHYSGIQTQLTARPVAESAQKLVEFSQQHSDSKLAQGSLWQALSLLYTEGRWVEAADLTIKYAEKYPGDSKNTDALKEAAKAYAESGRLTKAVDLLQKLAEQDKKSRLTYLESAADLLILEKKAKDARKIYNQLLTQMSNATDRARLFNKILDTFENKKEDPEYVQVQKLILDQNIEPYATSLLTERAKEMMSRNKTKEAFEMSRKIMSRNVASEDRAGARLIQAEVLEQEMISQSVKSSKEERFAMVLSMKTEKLEKAQTAYLSVTKMTQDPQVLVSAYQGIDRLYQNYIDSLLGMTPPASLSEADQKALKDEIAKITVPIQQRRAENQKMISGLSQNALRQDRQVNWAELPVENTIAAAVKYPSADKIETYLPKKFFISSSETEMLAKDAQKKCSIQKWKELNKLDIDLSKSYEVIESCYQASDYAALEEISSELSSRKKFQKESLFLLSLISERKGFVMKSLWFSDLALKMDASSPALNYQKARLQYKIDGLESAKPYFAKVLDSSMSSTEIQNLRAMKYYSEGNFETALQIFSQIPKSQIYNLDSGLAYCETLAQKGDVQKAFAVVEEILKSKTSEPLQAYLQQAHLFERFKLSSKDAVHSYEKAVKLSRDDEQKKWIERKINYLNGLNKTVGANVTLETK